MDHSAAAALSSRPRAMPALAAQATPGLHRVDVGGPRPALALVPARWQPGARLGLALLLHGAGGTAEHGLALLEPFIAASDTLLLAPASRDASWDAVVGRIGPDVAAIDRALHWAFERYAIDPQRVAIGGYSDGASYALSLGIANGRLFDRIVALSPGFVADVTARGRPRVYVSHGVHDPVLPIASCSRRIVPKLRQAGYAVDYREFDGGHEIPPQVRREAVEWLSR
jgi:predicted esterase